VEQKALKIGAKKMIIEGTRAVIHTGEIRADKMQICERSSSKSWHFEQSNATPSMRAGTCWAQAWLVP
jgi:hypothetical protein